MDSLTPEEIRSIVLDKAFADQLHQLNYDWVKAQISDREYLDKALEIVECRNVAK